MQTDSVTQGDPRTGAENDMNSAAPDIQLPPPTLRAALRLARMDLDRRLQLEGRSCDFLARLSLLVHRHGMGVFLYRLLDYAWGRGWRLLSKIGHLLLYFVGRVEIHPGARIGPGLVLPAVGGVGLPSFCTIGRNCTFEGPVLLTIGGMEGMDLSRDRIVLGDDCVIGSYVRIIGAVTLGNGTQVKARSVVMTSFPKDGYLISGAPARRRAVLPLSRLQHWSPLTGLPLPGHEHEFEATPASTPASPTMGSAVDAPTLTKPAS